MPPISENLAQVTHRIESAARRAGRDPGSVRLVAVSKTRSVVEIEAALAAGITDFGENRAQEFREKAKTIGSRVSWHFIGHLQSNKAKYVVPAGALIHSLDRWSLAAELERLGEAYCRLVDALVQVNISGEESKAGLAPEEVAGFLRQVSGLKWVRVRGLMTMAPLAERADAVRPVFRGLRLLAEELRALAIGNLELPELSMGMSNDFEIAVEEGATMVRIGTVLFGRSQETGGMGNG